MTLDTSRSTLRINNQFLQSQGQSVKHVGLHLRDEVFTHGKLYVALSWCPSSLKIKVIFRICTYTMNIVYTEISFCRSPTSEFCWSLLKMDFKSYTEVWRSGEA